jgi:membrane protein insertase Oxa1/YidC/SpoIIIJ
MSVQKTNPFYLVWRLISTWLSITVGYGGSPNHSFGSSQRFSQVVVNWGIAIIVLTLLVKLAFFQLSAAGLQIYGEDEKSSASHRGNS